MSTEIVIRWIDREIKAQRRSIVDIEGALWAVSIDEPTRWPHGADEREGRKRRFARLQRRHYPAGLKTAPFDLPPSNIRIVASEAHPLALYVAAEEIIAALAAMGQPPAVTMADIAKHFPDLGAPRWLHDCDDGDFVDFAMDAAGYQWTQHRIGRAGPQMSKVRYVYVLRQLEPEQGYAAVRELKSRARGVASA